MNVECTFRFNVDISGHMWQTTYMKWSLGALTARKTEENLKTGDISTLPAVEPLDSGTIHIIRPQPKTAEGNQYVVSIKDRYSKPTRAIQTLKTSPTHLANVFLKHWIIPSGIPTYLFPDSGPQLVSKLFASIFGYFGIKLLTTTAYHPQTDGLAKLYSRGSVARVRQFVTQYQQNWDLCVHPLNYAYNTQIYRSTNTSPHNVVLSRHPPRPSLLLAFTNSPIANDIATLLQMIRKLIQERIHALRAKVDSHVRKSQARYKHDYDRRVRETPTCTKGNYVFLDKPPLCAT